MKKGIILAVGLLLIIGLGVGAYWLGAQSKKAPSVQPALTPSPGFTPTVAVSPTPVSTNGTIEGSLSFPSEGIPEDLQVCAQNQDTKELYCTNEHIQDSKYTYGFGYTLDVPAGIYLVYASVPNMDYKAYYSEFVTCGLSVDCSSHETIPVEVKAGETTSDVDPQDWYK